MKKKESNHDVFSMTRYLVSLTFFIDSSYSVGLEFSFMPVTLPSSSVLPHVIKG